MKKPSTFCLVSSQGYVMFVLIWFERFFHTSIHKKVTDACRLRRMGADGCSPVVRLACHGTSRVAARNCIAQQQRKKKTFVAMTTRTRTSCWQSGGAPDSPSFSFYPSCHLSSRDSWCACRDRDPCDPCRGPCRDRDPCRDPCPCRDRDSCRARDPCRDHCPCRDRDPCRDRPRDHPIRLLSILRLSILCRLRLSIPCRCRTIRRPLSIPCRAIRRRLHHLAAIAPNGPEAGR